MASGEDTTRLLSRVPLFADLSERELTELAQVAVPRSWLAGEVIFREGDPGDTCYVVRSGAVRVTRRHSDGRQIALADLREGDIFGELAMFGGETRSATVEAVEPAERLARQTFQTVEGRVASALLGQVKALTAGSGGEPPREILIRATQAQIAQLSGASRESASRFLAKLERAGVITTGRGKILVHEPASLNNYIY